MAQVTAIIEPHSVPNDIRWGRLAEFGDVYLYSSADSINSGQLRRRYPIHSSRSSGLASQSALKGRSRDIPSITAYASCIRDNKCGAICTLRSFEASIGVGRS